MPVAQEAERLLDVIHAIGCVLLAIERLYGLVERNRTGDARLVGRGVSHWRTPLFLGPGVIAQKACTGNDIAHLFQDETMPGPKGWPGIAGL